MSKFCSQCGSKLNDNALFCSSCGAKVVKQETSAVENQPTEPKVNESANAETVTASENTSSENKALNTENAASETQEIKEVNETDSADKSACEKEKADTASDVDAKSENVFDKKSSDVKQPSEEPTVIDKGIAIAKDKIGDGYEKFKTSPNRDKYIGFSAIGIVLIVIICLLASIFSGGGYKSAVKDYMSAVENGDFNDYADSLPKIIYKSILKQYDGDKDLMKDVFEKSEKELSSEIDDIDYDILDVDKIDADDVEDSLRNQYELYADDKIKVSKAYQVDIRVVAEFDDDFSEKENRIRQTLIVAKVNGDWGVINTPASLLSNLG